MDSLTQFALGATVSAAVLGPRIGARKAILLGGVLGTLPDLDSFFPSETEVDAFTGHRGATHSLVMHAVAAPIIGELIVRTLSALRDARVRVYAAVYTIFATHALIDAITVYGTRLLWPIVPEPFGVGSMFIIDPLYTIPLLIICIWGLFTSSYSARFRSWVRGALAVSTVYMLASIPLQSTANNRVADILAERGIVPERVLLIPSPFNIIYWRAIVIDGPRYISLHIPLHGPDEEVTAYVHPRQTAYVSCLQDNPFYKELAAFSKGFYRMERQDNLIVMSDLRMGLTPKYVFRFALAEVTADGIKELDAPTRERLGRGAEGDWDWLLAGLQGRAITRPAEAAAQVQLTDLQPLLNADVAGVCDAPSAG